MPEFRDKNGQTWTVDFDGLLLADVREKAGADIVQEGLYAIEGDEIVLVKSLLALCREQIDQRKLSDRDFSRLVNLGPVLELALTAVRGAAQLFFQPRRLSEIQSRAEKRREADEQYQELKPMLDMLRRPDMPPALLEQVMWAIRDKIETATSSENSAESASASGLVASQWSAAGGSLDSSASIPAA